ncbi:MAG: (d)CMP kinase [Actinomycetota bacterium]
MTVVAIDGPAGAGKSSVAVATARVLGWDYVDTGALYRALALAALEQGIDPADGHTLGRLAADIELSLDRDRVKLAGRDVTARIRGEDVTAIVSTISAHPSVRAALVARQRALARGGGVVMEGRDIGTVVVPEARLKIFLTATLDERARRRARQLGLPEDSAELAALEVSIARRDEADSARRESPLQAAEDAVVVDSTDRDLDDVVAEIVARVRRVLDGA